jgi:hypothetical protein
MINEIFVESCRRSLSFSFSFSAVALTIAQTHTPRAQQVLSVGQPQLSALSALRSVGLPLRVLRVA